VSKYEVDINTTLYLSNHFLYECSLPHIYDDADNFFIFFS